MVLKRFASGPAAPSCPPAPPPVIQAGDVVQLRSGGPVMTVRVVGGIPDSVRCTFFDGSMVREETFPAVLLRHTSPKE